MKFVIKRDTKACLNLDAIKWAKMSSTTLFVGFGHNDEDVRMYDGEEARFFWRQICAHGNGRKGIEVSDNRVSL